MLKRMHMKRKDMYNITNIPDSRKDRNVKSLVLHKWMKMNDVVMSGVWEIIIYSSKEEIPHTCTGDIIAICDDLWICEHIREKTKTVIYYEIF